ncbi:hypothetical protein EV127DRAFT_422840 [Xylaria flabelliformis]|nr:hypothetical protein EV127DRAFT_422840 [Xylaria flabelliformis]
MADEGLVHKVRELGDMDLAALLCLISREHCIISTEAEYLDDLTVELQLVASRTFGLSSAVLDCTPETTLDDLVAAIQLQPQPSTPQPTHGLRTPSPLHTRGSETHTGAHHSTSNTGSYFPQQQQQQIANVILARNLDTAPKAVQIQCLELMRTRRIFTRTAVQACPKQFLLVAVLASESAGQARLTKHLNDHFYISHWQDPEDGFPHLDEDEDGNEAEDFHSESNIGGISNTDKTRREDPIDDDDTASQASSASVVRRTRSSKTPSTPTPAGRGGQYNIVSKDWALRHEEDSQATNNNHTGRGNQLFTETDISTLSTLSLQTHVDIEVQRYQMNVIAFLRLHRAVTPGSVPPVATTHFRMLIRSLAALHGLDFATPELVQLAARKIYAHHIVVVPPERERSMQWGSDLEAVKALLEDVQPEDVVEDVLGIVDVPL